MKIRKLTSFSSSLEGSCSSFLLNGTFLNPKISFPGGNRRAGELFSDVADEEDSCSEITLIRTDMSRHLDAMYIVYTPVSRLS
jgi:hypothetical protein